MKNTDPSDNRNKLETEHFIQAYPHRLSQIVSSPVLKENYYFEWGED